ncbi:MAG TPA: class I SAM-dependent methyltransferase [Candidatus Acidoferrales bacterium]|jgi:SAM-dependent methyltransferase|nr:class I SAM-dependent methyltransferase [Candidatus Acidoferrales bacterium]
MLKALLKTTATATNRMATYDDFAWFYNRYWNEEFHSLAWAILERIWLPGVPPKARILDVCCGTGYLAGLLTERGYQVTGIDASSAMIEHARNHVPAARFHVADATRFRLHGKFAAAVCTFDSLNHILSAEGLEAAFRNTAAALKPGAPFVFDMLLEGGYQTGWAEGFTIVRDDHVLLISDSGYDFRRRVAQCTITMFRLAGNAWRRSDVQVQERCYSHEEIDAALARANFTGTACYDARDLGMGGQLGEGRVFFVTRKE